ncbi:MAG: type III pantothenate kinase [Bacteroidales bacterium]|nr:type III pantothenate kinase [Bacteroidales bacterium]
MVHLVIDKGNSACKWAFFELDPDHPDLRQEPLEVVSTPSGQLLGEVWFDKYRPEACIYASVGKPVPGLVAFLQARVPFFRSYTREMHIPIDNAYRSPETLGLDRLAAAVGAWTLAPGRSSLIVDMGTAITYDFLSRDGVYRGGNIAPGIWLRLKVLHEETAALPLVEAREDFPETGTDTETAIRAGVMQGIWYELSGYMRQYSAEDDNLVTFLTGGDINYFDKKLKSGIFAVRNLVLIGLNRILYENAHI